MLLHGEADKWGADDRTNLGGLAPTRLVGMTTHAHNVSPCWKDREKEAVPLLSTFCSRAHPSSLGKESSVYAWPGRVSQLSATCHGGFQVAVNMYPREDGYLLLLRGSNRAVLLATLSPHRNASVRRCHCDPIPIVLSIGVRHLGSIACRGKGSHRWRKIFRTSE